MFRPNNSKSTHSSLQKLVTRNRLYPKVWPLSPVRVSKWFDCQMMKMMIFSSKMIASIQLTLFYLFAFCQRNLAAACASLESFECHSLSLSVVTWRFANGEGQSKCYSSVEPWNQKEGPSHKSLRFSSWEGPGKIKRRLWEGLMIQKQWFWQKNHRRLKGENNASFENGQLIHTV